MYSRIEAETWILPIADRMGMKGTCTGVDITLCRIVTVTETLEVTRCTIVSLRDGISDLCEICAGRSFFGDFIGNVRNF